MKVIIQGVLNAKVDFENTINEINHWLLVYVWISKEDLESDLEAKINKVVTKICNLKVLHNNTDGKINASVKDLDGEVMIISNFTLYWRNKKWNSIDYIHSAPFTEAEKVYDSIVEKLSKEINVKTWWFWAYMKVSSTVDGPLNHIFEY